MGNEYTSIKVTSTDTKGNTMHTNGLKVAFASSDMEWIDAHFGKTGQFVIYTVSKEGHTMEEVLKLNDLELEEGDDKNEEIARILAGKGIAILYIASIGPTAAAKVVKNRIHPLKVTEDTRIEEACTRLTEMLTGNPPPWIKRIISKENIA